MTHGQAEALLPMVEAAMRDASLPVSALDLIAATVGPGSFTGIRVGLAAARGIALAAGIPLLGVTGFEAVAAAAERGDSQNAEAGHGRGGLVLLVVLESRRTDLYLQFFDRRLFSDDRRRPLDKPAAVMPDALAERVRRIAGCDPVLIAGDAAYRAAVALGRRPYTTVVEDLPAVATGVARAALRLWRAGQIGSEGPVYLRPPDVTLAPRRAGLAIDDPAP
jgi:tRNA threonylcarbamoyladenosine biosynthesis protein TsaB